jgi:hypothetical protein
MKEYKYTVEEIRNIFSNKAQRLKKDLPDTTLWYISNDEIANILSKNSRSDAIKKLRELKNKYKDMALSGVYNSAIKMLEEKKKKVRA